MIACSRFLSVPSLSGLGLFRHRQEYTELGALPESARDMNLAEVALNNASDCSQAQLVFAVE